MVINASPPSEVSEADAKPPVSIVYSDIKQTLRAPLVNLIFRVLATRPDFLQISWRDLRPNAQTTYFEHQADAIRERAVQRMTELGIPPDGHFDEATEVLRVFHYVNPKLLVLVAALRAAVNGQVPKLGELPTSEKRQVPLGVPEGAAPITMVDVANVQVRVATIFEDITSTLGLEQINSDYLALAQWPDYLDTAWSDLKPIVQRPEYRLIERELRSMADEAVLLLPFRIDVNPHTMRLCGMSEADIDWARATLERFYRTLPGLVANIAFLSAGALGRETALKSPFALEGS